MKTNEIVKELKRALSTESAFYEEETGAYIDGLEFALKIADLEAYNEWLEYKQAEYDKMKLANDAFDLFNNLSEEDKKNKKIITKITFRAEELMSDNIIESDTYENFMGSIFFVYRELGDWNEELEDYNHFIRRIQIKTETLEEIITKRLETDGEYVYRKMFEGCALPENMEVF